MSEEIGHNCGWCVTHSLGDVYNFIKSLQHRGREATGIMAVGENRIDVIKWKGEVKTFDLVDLYKIFPSHNYHTYGAHDRYATRGRKDQILQDAHPHTIGGKIENQGNHIIIRNCDVAGIHNGQVNEKYLTGVDRNLLRTGCDTEALLHFYREKGEYELLKRIPGSYTMAIADKKKKEVLILRDRTGIKPGVLGWKDGKFGGASEDIAFRKNGGNFKEDLDSGSIYYLSPNGSYRKEKVLEPELSYCFFCWNYFADCDSVLNGVSVRSLRELLGEIAAEEFRPDDADFVTFLPRCPEVASWSYSKKTGIPFINVFYKMRGERAFLGSDSEEREASIGENLHLLDEIDGIPIGDFLKDKVIVDVDDSMVRGNNSKRARDLLYEEAGVKKVYHLNYTPPIGVVGKDEIPRGCEFGVDMPSNDEFIARGRTIKEISEKMGMQVVYLSHQGMLEAYKKLGVKEKDLCTYCIGGPHPFEKL
jgi:glutamine phosphoribosylpyrophosphate amidotransferase